MFHLVFRSRLMSVLTKRYLELTVERLCARELTVKTLMLSEKGPRK